MLNEFRSPKNVSYVAEAVRRFNLPACGDLGGRMYRFSTTYGQGGVLVDSDPLALRATSSRGANLWAELKRMNASFFQQLAGAAYTSRAGAENAWDRGGSTAGDEPLWYRMFEADSLRPPGLENLNAPGPLWAIDENQGAVSKLGPLNVQDAKNRSPAAVTAGVDRETFLSVPEEDQAWSAGDGQRTASPAVAEYYGIDAGDVPGMGGLGDEPVLNAASRTPNPYGPTQGDLTAWGPYWTLNGGSRFQRRDKIPRWQRAGHRPQLYTGRQTACDPGDVEETLGSGSREFGGGSRLGQVRGWDMRRLRDPRGEDYRKLGPLQHLF
ncbi:MAG: hypothetical protein P1U53_11100 [Sulfitobacter sp.]|nr:hypothetical protein [Sulfitobacter sp.]